MKAAILDAADDVVEIAEGTRAELLKRVPPGGKLVPMEEAPASETPEDVPAGIRVASDLRFKVAIFNENGAAVNVLTGKWDMLSPFLDGRDYLFLDDTEYASVEMAADLPSFTEMQTALSAK